MACKCGSKKNRSRSINLIKNQRLRDNSKTSNGNSDQANLTNNIFRSAAGLSRDRRELERRRREAILRNNLGK